MDIIQDWWWILKKLRKIKNSCAVIALQYVSSIDEDAVLRICKACGFLISAGMHDTEWKSAADLLGIEVHGMPHKTCRQSTWLNKKKKGLYLLGTCDHIFVVDEGIVIDPRGPKTSGMGRIIKQVWKVTKIN